MCFVASSIPVILDVTWVAEYAKFSTESYIRGGFGGPGGADELVFKTQNLLNNIHNYFETPR